MFVRASLAVLGLVHLLNGIYMLVAPAAWYTSVPGVTATGPFNHHFITDIGFAFAASGVGMIAGLRPGPTAGAFAFAGATWPTLHALFHLWEWITHGLPSEMGPLISTAIGVMGVSFAGLALAWVRLRRDI